MDYRYLDPRRPLRAKQTPQEAEERLMPYSELLPFGPQAYASQDKAVAGLRGVAAAPAGLESASLVLAVGGFGGVGCAGWSRGRCIGVRVGGWVGGAVAMGQPVSHAPAAHKPNPP